MARTAGLSILLWAALAVPAQAADATLSATSMTHVWEGGPGDGVGGPGFSQFRCTDMVHECDEVLLEITLRGRLAVGIDAGAGSEELDLRLYASDAQGSVPRGTTPLTPAPQPIAEDDAAGPDAHVVVRIPEPGFYVAQVSFVQATQGVYTGVAAFVPAIVPVPARPTTAEPVGKPAAAPVARPIAAAAKRRKALRACNRRARRLTSRGKRRKALRVCARRHAAARR